MSNPANLYGEFGRAVDPDADEDPMTPRGVVGSRERVVAEPQERMTTSTAHDHAQGARARCNDE